MSGLRDLVLDFRDCAGIRSEEDVIDVAQVIADLGLRPGVGAYAATSQPEPVDDVCAFVPTTRYFFEGYGPVDRIRMVEEWGYGAVWLWARGTRSHVSVYRRSEMDWDLRVSICTWSYEHANRALEEFVKRSTELLEQIGSALYPRVRPALANLYGIAGEIYQPVTVIRRDLVLGWRSWYGPAYVEKYGREVLLGLPDRAYLLDDGGVYHALDATPLQLVKGDRALYASVWPYLDQHGLEPAWPKRPRARKGRVSSSSSSGPARTNGSGHATEPEPDGDETRPAERTTDEVKAYVNQLLDTALVFAGGSVHLFMLPIVWSRLTEEQRVVTFRMLLYRIQEHQRDHPTVRIEIRFDEILPELRDWLEGAFPDGGPVSYGLLTDDPPE